MTRTEKNHEAVISPFAYAWNFFFTKFNKSDAGEKIRLPIALNRTVLTIVVKWSQEIGQRAKVYPEPFGGIRDGETPEVH